MSHQLAPSAIQRDRYARHVSALQSSYPNSTPQHGQISKVGDFPFSPHGGSRKSRPQTRHGNSGSLGIEVIQICREAVLGRIRPEPSPLEVFRSSIAAESCQIPRPNGRSGGDFPPTTAVKVRPLESSPRGRCERTVGDGPAATEPDHDFRNSIPPKLGLVVHDNGAFASEIPGAGQVKLDCLTLAPQPWDLGGC